MPLSGELKAAVDRAVSSAKIKTRGQRTLDPETGWYTYAPTKCSELFEGSNFNNNGYSLLSNYVVFRSGEGVQDGNGNVPCSGSASAWTTCCNNSPYVFVCNRFQSQTSSRQTAVIVHETMHVAGQREDQNPSTGPGDPPNTDQITATVEAACP